MTIPETQVDSHKSDLHLDPLVVERFRMLNLHQLAPNSAATRRYKRLNRRRTCGSLKKTSPSSSYLELSTNKATGANCYQDLLNTAPKAVNQVSDDPIPPVPLPLFRSFSDPTSSDHQQAEFTTPPRPGPLFRSRSSDQETPNSKNLRKFKRKMEDLWEWMGKVVQEEDQDSTHLQNSGIINKEQAKSENQETVCVKKTEEGLTLNFKCPCGGGYEVFLSGDKCFYRLD